MKRQRVVPQSLQRQKVLTVPSLHNIQKLSPFGDELNAELNAEFDCATVRLQPMRIVQKNLWIPSNKRHWDLGDRYSLHPGCEENASVQSLRQRQNLYFLRFQFWLFHRQKGWSA